MTSGSRELLSKDFRRGAAAILPMLIGVVPFGLIAGTTPVTGGLGMSAAVGFSTIVFAGASQLVAIDSLISGKGAAVAIMAAIAINLRLLLYSASLAPEFGRLPFRDRMKIAYLLTDQAYAVTHAEAENNRAATPDPRVALDEAGTKNLYRYYMGAGLTLWGSWQIATIVGGLIGNSIPSDIPVDFAVPLGRSPGWRRIHHRCGRVGSGPDRCPHRRPRRHRGRVPGRNVLDEAVAPWRAGWVRNERGDHAMNETWVTIVVAGAAAFSMRAVFLAFAHKLVDIPEWSRRILRQIPPAALAAIVIPAFLRPHNVLNFNQPRLWAGLLAAGVAFATKNTAATLAVGMAAVVLLG